MLPNKKMYSLENEKLLIFNVNFLLTFFGKKSSFF